MPAENEHMIRVEISIEGSESSKKLQAWRFSKSVEVDQRYALALTLAEVLSGVTSRPQAVLAECLAGYPQTWPHRAGEESMKTIHRAESDMKLAARTLLQAWDDHDERQRQIELKAPHEAEVMT